MIKDDECLDDLQNGLFIIQKKNGFKFGIDAVLLSDFAKETRSKKTLDLCTGTGIVPLLLSAKTYTPKIFGLEIQEEIAAATLHIRRITGYFVKTVTTVYRNGVF